VPRLEVVQPERVEPAVHVAVILGAEQAQRLLDLAADGRLEQQRVRVLGDVRRARTSGGNDAPVRRVQQAGQHAEQRGLPRTVASEQRDDVAAMEIDGDVVEHRPPPEHHAHAACGEQQLTGRSGRRFFWVGERVRHAGRPCAGVAHGEWGRVPAEDATEPRHARRAGIVGEHRARRTRRADTAAFDDHRAVRKGSRTLEPVLGEQHRGAEVGVETRERAQHVVGTLGIEL
jgi:hypothetical protein